MVKRKFRSLPVILMQIRYDSPRKFEILDKIFSFIIKLLPLFLIIYIPYVSRYRQANIFNYLDDVPGILLFALMAYGILMLLKWIIHYRTGNVFRVSTRFSIFGIIISLGYKSILKYEDKSLIDEMQDHSNYRENAREERRDTKYKKIQISKNRMEKYEQKQKEYERSLEAKKKEKEIKLLHDKNKSAMKKAKSSNSTIVNDYYEAEIEKNNEAINKLGQSIGGLN